MKEPLELNLAELESILEHAREGALSEEEHHKLKSVVTTLARLTQELEKKRTSMARLRALLFGQRTEKTDSVLKKPARRSRKGKKKKTKGHGRNGAQAYKGAKQVNVAHESLKSADPCPETGCTGKLYKFSEPGQLVRIQGMAPLSATVYELEKLRCNLCGTVFTAKTPEGIGEKKYDETAVSMIALLKYGAGFPFHRLEKLEGHLGIPLPSATQWDLLQDAAQQLEPVFEALVDQAAQGDLLHNDDTPNKILELMAENQGDAEKPERKGLFTSGIVAQRKEQLITLFFTGRNHAGENLQAVLERRSKELAAPIQMCDALSRNLPGELETLLANCLSHGRRKFVDVVANFPEEVQFVLETLAQVYKNDAQARKEKLSPQARLEFHQRESRPRMEELHEWFERQFANKTVEPNSGLGEAIRYMLNHWEKLTLFLRQPGVPLDNNIVERALKRAILHRKNSLFCKTQNCARVGDLFMSLIHTAELAGVNVFDYLCELQRHTVQVRENPKQWLPWNYPETLQHIATNKEDRASERSPPA